MQERLHLSVNSQRANIGALKYLGRMPSWRRRSIRFWNWVTKLTFSIIAVLISVIASEAKQSLATGLLRHFVPRNDTLKIESRNSVSVRDNVIIWTCLIFHLNLLILAKD